MVAAALAVSETARYLGSWDFAIAISPLRGACSWERFGHGGPLAAVTTYGADAYKASCRATNEQLTSDADSVVRELYAPLSRGLNSHLAVVGL
jgi:hypothetical protein